MQHLFKIIILVLLTALMLLPATTSAQTADGVVWRVEFYDNWYLQGEADWLGELGGPLNKCELGLRRTGWWHSRRWVGSPSHCQCLFPCRTLPLPHGCR